MKFLMIYKGAPKKAPPTPEYMAAIVKFSEDMTRSGVLLMTGGIQRPASGTRVSLADGAFAVTDGPFAETKELIDGFGLVEAKSREEAIAISRRFMSLAGDGESEVLRIYDPGDGPSPGGG